MKKISILFLIMLFIKLNLFGQGNLYFAKQRNSKKTNKVDLKIEYQIKTKNNNYNSRIIGFTDTSIKVIKIITYGNDSITTFNNTGTRQEEDRIIGRSGFYYHSKYRNDTINILFSNIVYIKKYLIQKNEFNNISTAVLILGSTLGLIYLPIALIIKGWKGGENWGIFQSILIGITAPQILIGAIKVKYNLDKKWKLVVK